MFETFFRAGARSSAAARGWVLLLVAAAFALWLANPIAVQNLRLAQFDQFQRWHPRATVSGAVRVVDIDEASLHAYGQWPWPRTRVAELVQRLHAAGASAIGLDVLLAEPDRTSPQAMAQLWNQPRVSAALQGLPDHDQVLAQALRGLPVVLGTSLSQRGAGAAPAPASASMAGAPRTQDAMVQLPYRMVRTGAAQPQQGPADFDDAVWPLPVLAASASGLGAMNFALSVDGVVRRVPLLLRLDGQAVPSLAAETLRVAQGARNYVLHSTDAGLQELRIGAVRVPTNAQGEMWLDYLHAAPTRDISAAQVLAGALAPGALHGQMVLVGSSAAGLLDLRFNPMGQLVSGVQMHALALEQMASGHYLQRPLWAPGAEALVLVLGALAVGWLALGVSARRAALVALGLLAVVLGGAWYAFAAEHLLLDAVNPALAMVATFVLASGVRHRVSERQQRWLRNAFSRYVSPNRVAHLLAHPEQLQLGGQRQVCSFVFTDLADFTTLMEGCDPAQAVRLLNEYLDGMLAIAFQHEGTLDRIMGDAVVVLFSAPVPQADHRQRALDCALAMDAFATTYAQRLQAQGIAWGQTRIGVHSGEVIVGNFGGQTLFDYRALGDPVNTASRLEGANKYLGTRVCVSQAVLDGCTGVPVRAVGQLLLKGKRQTVPVFAPLATLAAGTRAPEADYAAALGGLQPGPQYDMAQARAQFAALAARFPNDPLVALHAQRLQHGATDDRVVLDAK